MTSAVASSATRDRSQWILAASLACVSVKFATVYTGGFHGLWIVVTLSTALLAVYARRERWLALALLLGSMGDGCLANGRAFFLYGLSAFLCGHLAYIVYFVRKGTRPIPTAAVLLLAAYGAACFAYLLPGLGAMRIPVALYMTAIVAMAATSFRTGGWAIAAALLFVFSDTVLAVHRFRFRVPMASTLIWISYYSAQFLMARLSRATPARAAR